MCDVISVQQHASSQLQTLYVRREVVSVYCVCQVIHTYTTTPSFTLQWNPESTQGHCVYTCLYRGMSKTWNKMQEPRERKGKVIMQKDDRNI